MDLLCVWNESRMWWNPTSPCQSWLCKSLIKVYGPEWTGSEGVRPPIVSRWCFHSSSSWKSWGWAAAQQFFSGPFALVSTPALLTSATIFSYLSLLSYDIEHHTDSFMQPVCIVRPSSLRSVQDLDKVWQRCKTFSQGSGLFFCNPGLISVMLNLRKAICHFGENQLCYLGVMSMSRHPCCSS